MDTDWFAVDRCGHVALFTSGDSGRMPVGAVIHSGPAGGDAELVEMIFGSAPAGQNSDAAAGLFRYRPESGGFPGPGFRPGEAGLLVELSGAREAKRPNLRFPRL